MTQLLQHGSHTNNNSKDNYLRPAINTGRNGDDNGDDEDDRLRVYFPKWQSMYALYSINDRVTTAFANNFEQSRLEMALKVALDRGDAAAADRIRRSISLLLSQQQQLQNEFPTIDTNTISDNSRRINLYDDEEEKKKNFNNNLDDDDGSFQ